MLKTILIADDEPMVIKMMVKAFQKYQQKYNILQVQNGKLACQVAETQKIDLIILDWIMPVMSGVDALNYIKNQKTTKDIPIIIATGKMMEDIHLSKALENGAIDYIRKPISALELVARTRSALQLNEAYLKVKEQNQEIKQNYLKIKEQNHEIEQMSLREKELLKYIEDHKNRELSANLIQLQNKDNLILNIQESLKNDPSNESISKVLRLIQNNINLEVQWEKFKLHFEEVHPNFFLKLQKKFPILNDNDLRLCAYIKMLLSNKEIANLLNLTLKGIESARYRLKKRLNLPPEKDLNTFIRNL